MSSCKVTQVTPIDSKHSWGFLALNGDDILAGIWIIYCQYFSHKHMI